MRCDCCDSAELTELDSYGDYRHLTCKNCEFEKFVGVDAGISAHLYENDADYVDDLSVATRPDDLILWHHLEAIKYLRACCPSGKGSLLDIGCFNGFFVKKMLSLGYDAQGIDFNEGAVALGRENMGLGSRISTRTIEDMMEGGDRFDVVTLFEVLEHLPDIREFLRKATELLKEEGVLILSTPNRKMCWRPALDFPPHHLSRFSAKSLIECLSRLEMDTLRVEEQMSTYELTRHYVGTFFRKKDRASLRGGEFRHKKIATVLRRGMNRMRKVLVAGLVPIDKLLYAFNLRYISQIVIARKRSLAKQ